MFFDLRHVVTDEEIDAQQRVHNLRYLQWTLWAARDHAASMGFDHAQKLAENLGWVVRDHSISYRAATNLGDRVVVRTWIHERRQYVVTRKFVVCRPSDRTVLARGQTRWVYVDFRQQQAITIPDEIQTMVEPSDTPPLPWESTNSKPHIDSSADEPHAES
ncbi:MAG: acyl-CoA thioesterase [Planctomycetota bacterium]